MKKAILLASTAFSMVGYQIFAEQETDTNTPDITLDVETVSSESTTEVETGNAESTLSFRFFLDETEDVEYSVSLATHEPEEGETTSA